MQCETTVQITGAEARAVWDAHRFDVLDAIPGFIRTMGLPMPPETGHSGTFGRCMTPTQIRQALLADIGLHDRVWERVELNFWKAAARGAIREEHVGGLLNRITQRATWKLASAKARTLLLEIMPASNDIDLIGSIAEESDSAELMLIDRQSFARAASVMASLSLEERQLIDAKLSGGYAHLSLLRGKTVGALKTAAHRLWKHVCAECQQTAHDGRAEPTKEVNT